MKHALVLAAALAAGGAAAGKPPEPLAAGLKNPESVVVGTNGKVYVTVIGEFNADGDGAVVVLEGGKATPYVTGLDDPKGVAAYQKWLYVADKTRVLRVDTTGPGAATVLAPANAFPTEPLFLNDVAVDPESGTVYVSDSGDRKGGGAAVYRVTPQGVVSLVTDAKRVPGLSTPNGLALDGAAHLLLADAGTGDLHRVKVADGSAERLASGFGRADGIAWDPFGRLFVSDWQSGKVFGIPKPGVPPVVLADGPFRSAADLCFDPANRRLLVPDMKAGTVSAVPAAIPGFEVDEAPLTLKPAVAFPNLKWTDWTPETDTGKPSPLRPIVLTHAGDGSNRVFVATQHGVVHAFPNDQQATATKVFLDITDRVKYDDKTNEEGLLGLCFHPRYKETGEFFVFYTPKKERNVNVVSRFRVSKADPDRADPASEEEVIRFEKLFWNHDGGTILFGPDGFLYVTHGDGGFGGDPKDNGQALGSLLGKIHRIDVDHKANGKNYGIPKDNPFVGVKGARPEVYAYGFRNVWRMAFDQQTGQLWAADVGQNLYEEVNLVARGGNHGWNRREAFHPFGARGRGAGKGFVDPVWEYHHDIGKSITGGNVYRGTRLPELDGHYLYGDYVTAKVWALKYDEGRGRVVANRPVKDPAKPILSFGEDEKGEVYLLTTTIDGKGIYWFVK